MIARQRAAECSGSGVRVSDDIVIFFLVARLVKPKLHFNSRCSWSADLPVSVDRGIIRINSERAVGRKLPAVRSKATFCRTRVTCVITCCTRDTWIITPTRPKFEVGYLNYCYYCCSACILCNSQSAVARSTARLPSSVSPCSLLKSFFDFHARPAHLLHRTRFATPSSSPCPTSGVFRSISRLKFTR